MLDIFLEMAGYLISGMGRKFAEKAGLASHLGQKSFKFLQWIKASEETDQGYVLLMGSSMTERELGFMSTLLKSNGCGEDQDQIKSIVSVMKFYQNLLDQSYLKIALLSSKLD